MSYSGARTVDGDEGKAKGGGLRLGMAPKDIRSISVLFELVDSFELEDIGRMMAILYSTFNNWDIFGLGLKREKDNRNDENHEQGTQSAIMGADSLAENTPNSPKFIWLICPIGPKVWDIVEKRLHLVSIEC